MTILHLRINSNDQNISISKELRAQKMTLLRATISKDTGGSGGVYRGCLFFDIDFLSGFEYVSSLSNAYLIIPVSEETTESLQTYQMNQQMDSEDVKQSFNVKTFILDSNNKFTAAPIGSGTGNVIYVDLYFQISQLENYNNRY